MKRFILTSVVLSLFSFSLVIGCGEAKKDMKEEAPVEKVEEKVEPAADTTMSEDEMKTEEETTKEK